MTRIAFVLEAIVLLLGCCGCDRPPNAREYTSRTGLTFIGDRTFRGEATYFGMRLSRETIEEEPAWASVRLKIGNKQLHFGSVTPKDIVDLGGSVVPPSSGTSDDTTFAAVSWGEENRDGGIELKFRDDTLVEGWLHWHKSQPSPFLVSSETGSWISFPVDEVSVGKSFGPPKSVRDFNRK